jgi:hypothetical protein
VTKELVRVIQNIEVLDLDISGGRAKSFLHSFGRAQMTSAGRGRQ